MRFLNNREKVILVIMIMLTMVSVAVTAYLAINQTNTNIKTCCNQNIRVINTSGEIDNNFKEQYKGLQNKIGNYDVVAYDPPIQSSNLVPADWNQIVQDLVQVYNKYDAFVILGDHDTLPYTASALSFMLENLKKPIVLCDGDLASTLVLASQTRIPEVMIASGGKLLRGCRTIANSTVGFSSPNYPPLTGVTGLTIPKEQFKPKFINPKSKIAIIKLYPGIDGKDIATHVDNEDLQGIILEIWGAGRSPTSSSFLKIISVLAKKGVVIVAVSQCDTVRENYETDIRLLEAGVLSGYDMTTPAAYAKLAFLLGNVEDKKLIGQLMDVSFRGEMSLNNNPKI